MTNIINSPLTFTPTIRDYVWGGQKLKSFFSSESIDADTPLAEVWALYEGNLIKNGPFAGKTLAEMTKEHGLEILGENVAKQTRGRFPLLIKLLDCANWLSLQVHPNNEQAEQLEGAGHLGKTEAWYVVDADKDAQLLGGFRSGVTSENILKSLREGEILDLVQRHDVRAGDAIFIPAGLIHALGPGLLIYEVQQTSDITYRVYDWDRPMTAGRKLHLDQASVVLNPDLEGNLIPASAAKEFGKSNLVASDYFVLELIVGKEGNVFRGDTRGESFSAITALDGSIFIRGKEWRFELEHFETMLIPAVGGEYAIEFSGSARALNAFVPNGG